MAPDGTGRILRVRISRGCKLDGKWKSVAPRSRPLRYALGSINKHTAVKRVEIVTAINTNKSARGRDTIVLFAISIRSFTSRSAKTDQIYAICFLGIFLTRDYAL